MTSTTLGILDTLCTPIEFHLMLPLNWNTHPLKKTLFLKTQTVWPNHFSYLLFLKNGSRLLHPFVGPLAITGDPSIASFLPGSGPIVCLGLGHKAPQQECMVVLQIPRVHHPPQEERSSPSSPLTALSTINLSKPCVCAWPVFPFTKDASLPAEVALKPPTHNIRFFFVFNISDLWTCHTLFSNGPRIGVAYFFFQWFPTNFFPLISLYIDETCEISVPESRVSLTLRDGVFCILHHFAVDAPFSCWPTGASSPPTLCISGQWA